MIQKGAGIIAIAIIATAMATIPLQAQTHDPEGRPEETGWGEGGEGEEWGEWG
jgi:hypothetical protein